MRVVIGFLVVLLLAGCAGSSPRPPTSTSSPPPVTVVATPSKTTPGENQYRASGGRFGTVWDAFYGAQSETDIDDPLIAAGKSMTPEICAAVVHPDMERRRYAIGALGFIGDAAALPTLEGILATTSEPDYVRADALRSIYQIDAARGTGLAQQHKGATDMVGETAQAVLNRDPSLTEPTVESNGDPGADTSEQSPASHQGESFYVVICESTDSKTQAQKRLDDLNALLGDTGGGFFIDKSDHYEGMRPGWWVVFSAYENKSDADADAKWFTRGSFEPYVKHVKKLCADPIDIVPAGRDL